MGRGDQQMGMIAVCFKRIEPVVKVNPTIAVLYSALLLTMSP